ncbi:hypothetical protein FACS189437_01050 [Bacteroidia bacterium]|nr:hypothetical protein FACS189437_01050 [Bacteroidia bacterium]
MSKIYKMRIRYKREDFLTQGAVSAAWRELVQNSGLAYARAEKINPLYPRVTFGPPLALGLASECEFVDLYFENFAGEAEVFEKLSLAKKEGIEITGVKHIPYVFPSVASLSDAAEFYVSGFEKFNPPPLENFLKNGVLLTVAHENGFREEIGVKPYLVNAEVSDGILKITLRSVNGRNLRVELFLAKWLRQPALFENGVFVKHGVKIVKKNLYYQNSLGGYEVV